MTQKQKDFRTIIVVLVVCLILNIVLQCSGQTLNRSNSNELEEIKSRLTQLENLFSEVQNNTSKLNEYDEKFRKLGELQSQILDAVQILKEQNEGIAQNQRKQQLDNNWDEQEKTKKEINKGEVDHLNKLIQDNRYPYGYILVGQNPKTEQVYEEWETRHGYPVVVRQFGEIFDSNGNNWPVGIWKMENQNGSLVSSKIQTQNVNYQQAQQRFVQVQPQYQQSFTMGSFGGFSSGANCVGGT